MGRYPVAIAGAAIAAFGLFYLMQYLIESSLQGQDEEIKGQVIEIVRVERESETETKRRLPNRAKTASPPPPPAMQNTRQSRPQSKLEVGAAAFIPEVDIAGGPGTGGAQLDTDVTPLVRVPPQYPPRAAERGVEGWVLLEFTISKSGAPTNVTVVDADPPKLFNKAAIRAVKKWKYRPKLEGGQPVERAGVQTVITFQMEGS